MIRFGDFSLGMSRTNKKYDQYLAEISRFMGYLESVCPECQLVVLAIPEAEAEPADAAADEAGEQLALVADVSGCSEESPSADSAEQEKDQLGITKYIQGGSASAACGEGADSPA